MTDRADIRQRILNDEEFIPRNMDEAMVCSIISTLSLPTDLLTHKHIDINALANVIDEYIEPSEKLISCTQQRYEDLKCIGTKFLQNIKERGYCGDFLYLNNRFENPFPEETEKFTMFQGTLAEWLTGLYPITDLDPACTPSLPFTALISQIEFLQRDLLDALKKDDSDKQELSSKCIYDVRELLSTLPIFLVTTQTEGKDHTVRSIFDGKEYKAKIPKSSELHESGTDALGMYEHSDSYCAIYLWIDKIYSYRAYPLIFQMVLLHELIHFFFDIVRRSSRLDSCDNKENYNEETIDNMLVLLMYKYAVSPIENCAAKCLEDIKDFISHQPARYSSAIDMFENNQNWFNARRIVFNFFNFKKEYQ